MNICQQAANATVTHSLIDEEKKEVWETTTKVHTTTTNMPSIYIYALQIDLVWAYVNICEHNQHRYASNRTLSAVAICTISFAVTCATFTGIAFVYHRPSRDWMSAAVYFILVWIELMCTLLRRCFESIASDYNEIDAIFFLLSCSLHDEMNAIFLLSCSNAFYCCCWQCIANNGRIRFENGARWSMNGEGKHHLLDEKQQKNSNQNNKFVCQFIIFHSASWLSFCFFFSLLHISMVYYYVCRLLLTHTSCRFDQYSVWVVATFMLWQLRK